MYEDGDHVAKKEPICGTYVIRNLINGKVYVGSSKNVEHRFKAHRASLVRGKHQNLHLQRAWVLHGERAFVFECVEVCALDVRFEREQVLIDAQQREDLYNNRLRAIFVPDTSRGAGRALSSETRRKIGDANRGRPAWNAGGSNTWAPKAARARVDAYTHEIVAVHVDGSVLRFSHEAEAARHFGYKRKRVSESLRREGRLTTGWQFSRVLKEVSHPNL